MLAQLKTVNQLASFLGIGLRELRQLKPQDHYITFQIPKPGKDEKRTIEAPTRVIRNLLDRLSDGLQWEYSDHRTHAAQGFIRSVKDDPDKRTIFTNARRHLVFIKEKDTFTSLSCSLFNRYSCAVFTRYLQPG